MPVLGYAKIEYYSRLFTNLQEICSSFDPKMVFGLFTTDGPALMSLGLAPLVASTAW